MNDIPQGLGKLRAIVAVAPSMLAAIDPQKAGHRAHDGAWSPKEELGHLIDSAANNHQRVVRGQIENNLALPGYDQNGWVKAHRYQEQPWQDVIGGWVALNTQLLRSAECAPDSAWSNTLSIKGSEPVTLGWVLDDYVTHLLHHLEHIGLDRQVLESAASLHDAQAQGKYPQKTATTDYPVHELIARRWSPRVFDEGRAIERKKLFTLLEAARWAPSCFNEQPWRYLVFDGSDPDALDRARQCLVEGNAWALKAPLLMLSVAYERFSANDKPNRHAQHDVGLASENLVLEATALGLVAHQMAGYDAERARREFGIPEGFTPMAMIAIGYPYQGSMDVIPEKLMKKEVAPRERRPLGEVAFDGKWGRALSSIK
ncbi:MAG TPA: nitroreductase family protein [Blastocatellia bacterium]|nr:nitroreductase family protein [Blastocatellia bacterium]